MRMGDIILDIQNISKSFYSKTSGENYVLKNLNLSINKNKITALIGGNGTGKTTLFNIISRFIDPNEPKSSKIIYDEKNLLKCNAWQLASLGIGRLFQDAHIFPDLSILENMLVADADTFGEKPIENIIFHKKVQFKEKKRTQKAVGILSKLFGKESIFIQQIHLPAGNLSYGQQRLLGLARLLMGDYQLILLDEPTAGVHIQLNDKIAEIILLLKEKGKTVFLIEHNMAFVRKIADETAFMDKQNIRLKGKTSDVLNNEDVQKNYLGII